MIILEKAWAKLHGSYERIIGGMAHYTFRDLTGAPAYEYSVTPDDENEENDIWQIILDADKKDYIMSAGIAMNDKGNLANMMGLIDQHSYGLIGAAEVMSSQG